MPRPVRHLSVIAICDPTERRFLERSQPGFPLPTSSLVGDRLPCRRGDVHNVFRCSSNAISDTLCLPEQQIYQHEALPNSSFFRLLEIAPGLESDKNVACSLTTTAIGAAPYYEALSYTWGTSKDFGYIICDGNMLKITHNLLSALRRLRLVERPRSVWVDAVCINQSNQEEKESQINIMRIIYKQAGRVLIWLGEDCNKQAEPAFRMLNRLARKEDDMPPSNNPSWHPVLPLYDQHWFSRVWIIQEVAMATCASVIWGSTEAPWETVSYGSAVIATLGYQLTRGLSVSGVHNAHVLHKLARLCSDRRYSLLHWLELTRNFKATNPRDHIYALLGILEGDIVRDGQGILAPNYARTTRSLYTAVARKIMKHMASLDALSAVQQNTITRYRPTWVPRWNFSLYQTIGLFDPNVKGYQTSEGLPQLQPTWVRRYGQILKVTGLEFDRVMEASEVVPGAGHSNHDQIKTLAKILARTLSTCSSYPTNQCIEKVCCWTATAGKDHYGELIANACKHFDDFVTFCSSYGISLSRVRLQPALRQISCTQEVTDRYQTAALNSCAGRKWLKTAKGYIALGPPAAQHGDIICILCSAIVPFILRKVYSNKFGKRYVLVGEAYIHGIMNGEAVEKCRMEGIPLVTFEIE